MKWVFFLFLIVFNGVTVMETQSICPLVTSGIKMMRSGDRRSFRRGGVYTGLQREALP